MIIGTPVRLKPDTACYNHISENDRFSFGIGNDEIADTLTTQDFINNYKIIGFTENDQINNEICLIKGNGKLFVVDTYDLIDISKREEDDTSGQYFTHEQLLERDLRVLNFGIKKGKELSLSPISNYRLYKRTTHNINISGITEFRYRYIMLNYEPEDEDVIYPADLADNVPCDSYYTYNIICELTEAEYTKFLNLNVFS